MEKSPLTCFYNAEEYHQQYLVKNPEGYCHLSASLLRYAKTYAQIIRELRQNADTRKVAEKFKDIPSELIEWLQESESDEARLCAHLILADQSKTTDDI